MNPEYTNTKVIGFDLDQTLYPKSPEIDHEIQKYIYQKISNFKNISIGEANKLFNKYYPNIIGSGSKTLIKLGFPYEESKNIVQEALESADIAKFLIPNHENLKLLQDIKEKFGSLSLITGSNRNITEKKLKALGIPLKLFDCLITTELSKSDGTAFRQWLKHFKSINPSLESHNFLYIGDRKISDSDVPNSLGIKSILVNIKEKDPELNISQLKSLLDLKNLLF